MQWIVLTAFLAFTPPSLERQRPVMATVTSVTAKGELATDRGAVQLAGVTVTNREKAHRFLRDFVVNKLVKLEYEPGSKAVHAFVSSDCAAADKLLGEKSEAAAGECVRSIYVNEILLKKKWAKAAPEGVTLYRARLFPSKP